MSSAAGYSIVPIQKVIIPLRIIQLVFGLVVLGISAYQVSLYAGSGYSSDVSPVYVKKHTISLLISPPQAGGLGIFVGLATMIFITYWFVATSSSGRNLYNYWAIFATELFVLIFWLCTFALVASKVALLAQYNADFSGNSGNSGNSGSGGSYTSTTNGNGQGQACYDGYCINYKRGLDKRAMVDPFSATLYTDLAVSVVNL
jgi:hypothetical protein